MLLTKTDTVSPQEVQKALDQMKKVQKNIFAVSVIDDESIKAFQDSLTNILNEKK